MSTEVIEAPVDDVVDQENASDTPDEKAERVEARNKRTLSIARQITDVVVRRQLLGVQLADAKEEMAEASKRVSELKKDDEQLEEEIYHLAGLIASNESGQLTFNFDERDTDQPFPSTTDVDHGAEQPLAILLNFGLSKSKLEQLQESKAGQSLVTVGDLEQLITKTQGWYWKDIKGWGETFATGEGENGFLAIHERFRREFPCASADGTDTRQKRCNDCGEVYDANLSKCPVSECSSPFFELVDDDVSSDGEEE